MAEHRLAGLSAPSISDIEELAAEAFRGLPDDFRALCGEMVISVTDFPTEEVQKDMAAGPFDLLVNATSLGHTGSAPLIDPRWLTAGGLCYDLNYGPAAKPLRDACAAAGIRYSDGLGMLVGQAALSFELWTGKIPDATSTLNHLAGTNGVPAAPAAR